MIPLQFRARVWVPTVRAPLPEVEKELEALTAQCGGCTRTAATGEWVSEKSGYVSEPVRVYEWWSDRIPSTERLILALLRAGEESVMVEVNGAVLLLFPHDYPTEFRSRKENNA